jgi:hypothetical protein
VIWFADATPLFQPAAPVLVIVSRATATPTPVPQPVEPTTTSFSVAPGE